MRYTLRNKNFWIMLLGDMAIVFVALYMAFLIRFDGRMPASQLPVFYHLVVWIIPLKIVIFFLFNFYRGMWRYTSIHEFVNVIKGCVVSSVLIILIIFGMHRFSGYSRGVIAIDLVLTLMLVGGLRLGIRIIYSGLWKVNMNPFLGTGSRDMKNLLIIGAGSAGEKLLRELNENRSLKYRLMGFIDDDPYKTRQTLHGIPVLGKVEEIETFVQQLNIDEVIIAVPSANPRQIRAMVDVCTRAGVTYKTIPGLGEIIRGDVSIGNLREVKYDDLLKREPVNLKVEEICEYLTNKRVLVTGGAGSIGSELCRQIAGYMPEKLIILDRNESGLYELALDVQAVFPELEVVSVLGAVQNRERMEIIFGTYKPQVVFHAAAYKHVPMIEMHPWEAVFNNIIGSKMILDMSHQFQVDRCVLVSTDKAVRPTNVMGATKRLVEMLMQSYASINGTRLMAVRFGNVLGSAGSVLPLFKKQIKSGGPVTVTDPRVTRYFMTIPEASSLILQTGAMGKEGEIFVLKMGTPVRIAEMARDLIKLSGFEPEEEIEIRYTGLRPGEKLYEELITQDENIQQTHHQDIMVLKNGGCMHVSEIHGHIEELVKLARPSDAGAIRKKLAEVIPEYSPWATLALPEKQAENVIAYPSNGPVAVADSKDVKQAPRSYLDRSNLDRSYIGKGEYAQVLNLSETDFLMLRCVREPSKKSGGFSPLSLTSTEWHRVIRQARRHGLASLIDRNVRRAGIADHLPPEICATLRNIYLDSTRQNMWMFYELGRVLQRFNQENIPVIVLKGAHLGKIIYNDIGLRTLGDIDLLFKMEHLGAAQEILGALGYDSQEKRMFIDIHWFLATEVDVPMEAIWRRARPARLGGQATLVLCPEDLLLHLCIHAGYHHRFQFVGLKTLCDIREVILKYGDEINWKQVLDRAGRWGVPNVISLTLLLAHEVLDVPVPHDMVASLKHDRFTLQAQKWAMDRMFDTQLQSSQISPHFMQMLESNSVMGKLSYLRRVLFPPKEFIAQKYPVSIRSFKVYYYYFHRFFQKTGTYARALLNVVFREKQMASRREQQRQDTEVLQWLAGKREQRPEVGGQRSEVGGQKGKRWTRDDGRGKTDDQMSEVGGQRSEVSTRNPEPATLNPEPRTLNPESRTLNPEPRTEMLEAKN